MGLLLVCLPGAWAQELAAPSPEALADVRLALGPGGDRLRQRLDRWLAAVAPPGPVEDWPPGLTVAQQVGPGPGLEDPLDLVVQGRVPLEYSPSFLPEHYPDLTAGQMSGEELLNSWRLEQGLKTNPLRVAQNQAEEYGRNSSSLRRQMAWLGAYWWVHQGHDDSADGAADVLLSAPDRVREDVLVSLAAPWVLGKLPAALKDIPATEGEAAVELRMTVGFSYDSVAQFEETLLQAAARGLQAVVIAGRGQLGDAQTAIRTAARLQRQGRLAPGFRVIPGQIIESRSGAVVGLFLREAVLEGQTLSATVQAIHGQGGLAYLARPGDIGAPTALRSLPFDGYFIQPGNFELFRTLQLLHDPRYADKPALYATGSPYSAVVGLPHSNVTLDRNAPDPLRAGLEQKQAYAAGAIYLPWMMLLFTKPVAAYQKTLNRYFELNEGVAQWLRRKLRSDHVILRTNWDDEMRNLISLSKAWSALQDVLSGDSQLTNWPEVNYIEVEYDRVAVGYDRGREEFLVRSRWQW